MAQAATNRAQRGAEHEYDEKVDFDDFLKGNRRFSVLRVPQNNTKFNQNQTKKEEKEKKCAKEEQIEAKVRSKTRPEPQKAAQKNQQKCAPTH